ncbi:putative AT-hook motif nuclear-localized protein 15-29 [Helianthus annuus]|nr:putative AT-hook motif nuclear-localized protein 15-29 [Helianthus annuus]
MLTNNHPQSPPSQQHHLITTTTTSDEADIKKEPKTTTNDGEVVRRPRGRPPGTKNKPKSSVSVTRQPDPYPCMSSYVLEIEAGSDIIAALKQFCNLRKIGLCVLSGSGCVSNVAFRLPTSSPPQTLHGCYSLLAISATVFPSSFPISTILTPPSANNDFLAKFVVSIVDQNGKTCGGAVVGPLIAAGTVYIVAATCNNPIYYRLPKEDNNNHIMSSEYGYVPVPIDQSLGLGNGGSGQHHAAQLQPVAVEPLSMYGGRHLVADFGWPPTPRKNSSHY